METVELKFLLQLLEFEGHRAPLAQLKFSPRLSAAERRRICTSLCDRGLVGCIEAITTLKITLAGKTLLKLGIAELPVTPDELKLLKQCAKAAIAPEQAAVPTANRETIIKALAARGLIQIETQVKEVYLTETGKKLLQEQHDDS